MQNDWSDTPHNTKVVGFDLVALLVVSGAGATICAI